jgi:hypothetical protein
VIICPNGFMYVIKDRAYDYMPLRLYVCDKGDWGIGGDAPAWMHGALTHPVIASLDLPSLPQAAKRAEEKYWRFALRQFTSTCPLSRKRQRGLRKSTVGLL